MKALLFLATMTMGSLALACGNPGEGFQQNDLAAEINQFNYICDSDRLGANLKLKVYAKYRCVGSPTYAILEDESGKTMLEVDAIQMTDSGFTAMGPTGDAKCSFIYNK